MGLAYDVVPIRISMPGSTPGGMFGKTIRSPSPLVSKKRHRAFSKIYPSTAYSPAPTTRRSLRFRRMIQRTGVQRPQQMSQHAQGRVRRQQEKTWLSCRSTKSRDRSGRDGGALPSSQVRRGESSHRARTSRQLTYYAVQFKNVSTFRRRCVPKIAYRDN